VCLMCIPGVNAGDRDAALLAGGSEVMIASRPPSATASIALAGAAGYRSDRGVHPAVRGDRTDLCGPILVVVVDHVARPEFGHPLLAYGAATARPGERVVVVPD
jgi:hypothetical protein